MRKVLRLEYELGALRDAHRTTREQTIVCLHEQQRAFARDAAAILGALTLVGQHERTHVATLNALRDLGARHTEETSAAAEKYTRETRRNTNRAGIEMTGDDTAAVETRSIHEMLGAANRRIAIELGMADDRYVRESRRVLAEDGALT